MQQRTKRADDQGRRLVEPQVGHVAEVEHQFDARLVGTASGPSSMAGEVSTPITGRPVANAMGTATRPLPIASSTIGPSASRASPT